MQQSCLHPLGHILGVLYSYSSPTQDFLQSPIIILYGETDGAVNFHVDFRFFISPRVRTTFYVASKGIGLVYVACAVRQWVISKHSRSFGFHIS